jgi:hypothetical protein
MCSWRYQLGLSNSGQNNSPEHPAVERERQKKKKERKTTIQGSQQWLKTQACHRTAGHLGSRRGAVIATTFG